MNLNKLFILILSLLVVIGCRKDVTKPAEPIESNLTIFIINDQQAQIDNFAKVKHIIDEEKKKQMY